MSDDKKVIIDKDEIIDEVIASFAIDDMFVDKEEMKKEVEEEIKKDKVKVKTLKTEDDKDDL